MKFSIPIALCAFLAAASWAAEGPSEVKIVPKDSGYQLLRNGQPYFIKGVCGSSRLEELVAAGGNSIRTYGVGPYLDQAQKNGLTVLLGLSVGKPRQGFDYSDPQRVARQLEKARQDVLKCKDHPALLMWALGNETELRASKEDRIRVWKAVNQMAEMIKQVDGKHPVITVLCNLQDEKLREMDEYCPALDAVGINAYGAMLRVPETVGRQEFKRPWLITEFGPRGHWEVPKTAWNIPIEDSSAEKADLYLKAYRHTVAGSSNCIGSYVFLWSQKQEKTHTWYGMFLPDGRRLEPVDAMTMAWTGRWPTNRCPHIGSEKITVNVEGSVEADKEHVFAKGARLHCKIDVSDPEGEPLKIEWDLRPDVSDNSSTGGDFEPATKPIDSAVVSAEKLEAIIQLPNEAGKYRIFVYAGDPHQSAATVNLPILVR